MLSLPVQSVVNAASMREMFTRWVIREVVDDVEHRTNAVCRLSNVSDEGTLQALLGQQVFNAEVTELKLYNRTQPHEKYTGHRVMECKAGGQYFRLIETEVL